MLIGFTGKAGSGKSTAAKVLGEITNYQVVSFATQLREELTEVFKSSDVDFFSQDKNQQVELLAESINQRLFRLLMPYRTADGWSLPLRKILQIYGTDYRRAEDEFYWIHKLFFSLDNTKSYIIDDIRFHNEAEMLHILGGHIIKLELEEEENKLIEHSSELDIYTIRHIIKYTQPDRNDIPLLRKDLEYIYKLLLNTGG